MFKDLERFFFQLIEYVNFWTVPEYSIYYERSRPYRKRNRGGHMAKEDVVATQLKSVQDAEVQALESALGACFDAGAASVVVPDVSALNAKIAQDAADLAAAQAKAQSDLATLQAALDAETAKETMEANSVQALKDRVTAVQASLDQIKALILGTVAPAAPAAPVDPAPAAPAAQ